MLVHYSYTYTVIDCHGTAQEYGSPRQSHLGKQQLITATGNIKMSVLLLCFYYTAHLFLPMLGHYSYIYMVIDCHGTGQEYGSPRLQHLGQQQLITETGNIKMRVLLLHISSFLSYARALLLHLYRHRLSRDRTGIRPSKAKAFGSAATYY